MFSCKRLLTTNINLLKIALCSLCELHFIATPCNVLPNWTHFLHHNHLWALLGGCLLCLITVTVPASTCFNSILPILACTRQTVIVFCGVRKWDQWYIAWLLSGNWWCNVLALALMSDYWLFRGTECVFSLWFHYLHVSWPHFVLPP